MASAVVSAAVRALRAPGALGSHARGRLTVPIDYAGRRAVAARGSFRRLAARAEAATTSAAPPPAGVDPQQAYDSLKGQQVVLVSAQKQLDLTSLWEADERAVLVFARHMGEPGAVPAATMLGARCAPPRAGPRIACLQLMQVSDIASAHIVCRKLRRPPPPVQADCSAGSLPASWPATYCRPWTQLP